MQGSITNTVKVTAYRLNNIQRFEESDALST